MSRLVNGRMALMPHGMALCVLCISAAITCPAVADDWLTYRHDVRRSGVSDATLKFPLEQCWVRRSNTPPQTAWTGPAKWDAYSGNSGLQSMRNFDPCFYVTVAGDRVFFGSSIDDSVHALDAATGKEQWVFFTDAAVRFPPTLSADRAYFGSDDGNVYCCEQSSGKLVWKQAACDQQKHVPSNGKIISLWPVRTGVLLQDGKAIFAGSLVPWKKSYLWKVDAATGDVNQDGCFRSTVNGVTLQGALLASSDRIYVPQGRAAPLAFDAISGAAQGAIGEAGGVFCVLTEDELLLAGPQNQKSATSQIRVADGISRRRLASFSGANRILVDRGYAWIPSNGRLKKLDRAAYVRCEAMIDAASSVIKDKKKSAKEKSQAKDQLENAKAQQAKAWVWDIECDNPNGFIKCGEVVFVGLVDEVRGYSAKNGQLVWQAKVDGVAHGLAVAGDRLFVSTGLGHIYAFESQQ